MTRRRTLPLTLTLATAMGLTVGLAACGSDTSSDSDTAVPPASVPVDTTPTEPPGAPVTEPLDAPTEPPGAPVTEPLDAPTEPTGPTPSPVSEPSATIDVEIDDGTFASIAEMAAASTLVVVGEVVETKTIGRPDLAVDPAADEYVAIIVQSTETLVGSTIDEVVLGWNAYTADAEGSRTAIRVMNGLRPPTVGDHVLLFLAPVDPAFAEHVGGAPTHQLVKLDGLVHLDGDRVVGGEANSPVIAQMLGRTIAEFRPDLTA